MEPILETKNLSKYFGSLHVVNQIDLRLYPGQLHSIIGPNGAGKTTLLNLLTGILRPNAGKIHFFNREISGFPMHRRAIMGLGRSFQIINVLPEFTVYENIRIAVQRVLIGGFRFYKPIDMYSKVRQRTLEILEFVGLVYFANQEAERLSHGDQKHLELAITLASQPKLLLLDEPTAGISPDEISKTIHLIQKTAQQVTILIVEHNMDIVMSLSDVITVMHQGRILAEGSPQEIKENPEVKKAYLGN